MACREERGVQRRGLGDASRKSSPTYAVEAKVRERVIIQVTKVIKTLRGKESVREACSGAAEIVSLSDKDDSSFGSAASTSRLVSCEGDDMAGLHWRNAPDTALTVTVEGGLQSRGRSERCLGCYMYFRIPDPAILLPVASSRRTRTEASTWE